jgi:hypothetical protein
MPTRRGASFAHADIRLGHHDHNRGDDPERSDRRLCPLADVAPVETTMPAIRTFFATCFEEWYLHKRRYFDQGMWDMWRRGMHNLLNKPAIREAWERISMDTAYGPEFIAFVSNELTVAVTASSSRAS